jgi:1,4-dihydroxy-2-naphthoate octaprenyltransferase
VTQATATFPPDLERTYSHAVLSWVGDDGYPMSVASRFSVKNDRVVLHEIGEVVSPPSGRDVNVIFSHIRPRPGEGYDERRYISAWGRLRRAGAKVEFTSTGSYHWDEKETPFFQYSELTVPQAHRFLGELSERRGETVKPKLAAGWLFLRATRLPFLTATAVPVFLGVAMAARNGPWRPGLAALTLLAACLIHLGLNVANDVFDDASGADEANTRPTQFSGGSRVIQYGLVSRKTMALMAAGFYAAGIGIGLWLAATSGFWPLFWLGVVGVFISIAYTAPPLRLVHRGIGEVIVALGFGPIVTLGAFYVQAQRYTWEALYASLPVALLIALVLYLNEIPDRTADAVAGKRTLPVRWSKRAVLRGYALAVAATYGLIVGGVMSGLMPVPALTALLTIPMAIGVYKGAREAYDDPYALMPAMAKNIQLHLATGMLLVLGFVASAAAHHLTDDVPRLLR